MAAPINRSAASPKAIQPTPAPGSESISKIVEKFRAEHNQLLQAKTSLENTSITELEAKDIKRIDAKKFRNDVVRLLYDEPRKILISIPGCGLVHRSHLEKMLYLTDLTQEDFVKCYKELKQDEFFEKECPLPPITTYVLKGDCEGVKKQIEMNQLNAQDANGKTPLMWAVIFGHQDIIDILLKAEADLNLKDTSKRSAIDFAILNNDLELVQLLMLLGAIPDIAYAAVHDDAVILKYLLDQGVKVRSQSSDLEDPISFAVRSGKKENVKLLVEAYNSEKMLETHKLEALPYAGQLLMERESTRSRIAPLARQILADTMQNFTEASEYKRLLTATKIVSHALELEAAIKLDDEIVMLEGSYSELNSEVIARGWKEYAKEYLHDESPETLDSIRHLQQTLHQVSDQNARTPEQLLMRINRGMPVMISVGYKGKSGAHAANFLIWRGYLVHCDRGGEIPWKNDLTIYTYDPEKMNVDILQHIMNVRDFSFDRYQETVQKILPDEIGLKQIETLEIPHQKVGNCSWACLEGASKGFLYLSKKMSSESNDRDGSVDRIFHGWQTFQRLQALEQYLDLEYDPLVASKALKKLDACDPDSLRSQRKHLYAVLKKYAEKEITRLEKGGVQYSPSRYSHALAWLEERTKVAYLECDQICRILYDPDSQEIQQLKMRLDAVFDKYPPSLQRILKIERLMRVSMSFPLAYALVFIQLSPAWQYLTLAGFGVYYGRRAVFDYFESDRTKK